MANEFGRDFGRGMMNMARAMSPVEADRQEGIANRNASRQEMIQKLLITAIQNGSISKEDAIPALRNAGMDELLIKDIAGEKSLIGKKPEKPETFKSGVPFLLPDGKTEVQGFQKGSQIFYRGKGNKLAELPFGSTRAPTKQLQGELTTKTQNTVDDQRLKTMQGIDRLKVIRDGFKPEFTQVGTKASVKFNAFVEKAFGVNLSKADKKQLNEFTTFARNTIGNLNQHIRDRTGAVMNAAEIPRMMGEVPVIGDGIFDGDSATQFTAKLNGLMSYYEAAEARLNFVNANGLTPDRSERDQTGQWVPVSTSGYSLDEFRNLPQKPAQFDQAGWDRMSPSDRRELVSLMNRKR